MSGGYFDKSYGNWLPEEIKDVVVGECPNCGEDICEGDVAILFDGEYLCDTDCLLDYIGAENTVVTL